MSPEEYAIQLIIDGAASTAEDDLNEDGAIADNQHQEACDLALAIVRAIREDATIRAQLVAAGVAQQSLEAAKFLAAKFLLAIEEGRGEVTQ